MCVTFEDVNAAAKRIEHPTLSFASAAAWNTWLKNEHARAKGVWIKIARKSSGLESVDYPGALDVALTWGWIDGQRASFDETHFLQKFTPRGKRSIWSKVNRDKIAALEKAGKMQPAGRAEVERAKADGRWDAAYDSPSNAKVPDDLAAAFAKSPRASKLFAVLDATNRYAVLHRVQTAKKPETRAARIAKFVAMLAKGETIHPRKQAK
ncbi:YdeI/OmpD-associated family protein [soil metagenome]